MQRIWNITQLILIGLPNGGEVYQAAIVMTAMEDLRSTEDFLDEGDSILEYDRS